MKSPILWVLSDFSWLHAGNRTGPPFALWVLCAVEVWGVETGTLPSFLPVGFPGEVSHPSLSGHSGPEILSLLGTDWPGHWDHPSISSCFLSTSPLALEPERSTKVVELAPGIR